jgi:hypothetical protein
MFELQKCERLTYRLGVRASPPVVTQTPAHSLCSVLVNRVGLSEVLTVLKEN